MSDEGHVVNGTNHRYDEGISPIAICIVEVRSEVGYAKSSKDPHDHLVYKGGSTPPICVKHNKSLCKDDGYVVLGVGELGVVVI